MSKLYGKRVRRTTYLLNRYEMLWSEHRRLSRDFDLLLDYLQLTVMTYPQETKVTSIKSSNPEQTPNKPSEDK